MTPLTASTGHVAHQPTTATVRPSLPATSQTAGTSRSALLTGRSWPLSLRLMNQVTPCSCDSRPVPMVVHKAGDSSGCGDLVLTAVPPATRAARFGTAPLSINGSMRSHSAPSTPMTRRHGRRSTAGVDISCREHAATHATATSSGTAIQPLIEILPSTVLLSTATAVTGRRVVASRSSAAPDGGNRAV